ncbi:shikimate dehydrogenase [Pseudomonas sp. CBSPBW29]|uniref:shikimate dehydrogenase family protein n=1 Tax=Pseudomonas sp. CBS TaxID=2971912 RepID=UPI0021AC4CD3|nr:shikimate dehydrogenase [Pseudomonas sp. CBS]WEL43648.1 shikimate dehydrogenase [Pseudomonas sp. CBSPBW29]WEL64716.1 shikimate dehydrogenase [Pseudomonas sp. CBSPGW29]WEL68183.1 shikimate dehydrogenase [Pseudomonas sp. CBSPCGW29]WEL80553.1 shikimate dehydrogenase [Pseudomonas sp. CBSPCAW29]WEL89065.1 shikimate dehydrogenase [Pseudomonas sp. CBSPCBW29]
MHPGITDSTRIYGLIGAPLKSAKSPVLLNRLFAEAQANAVCIPLEVGQGHLADFVKGIRAVSNIAGLLVTMPHKQTMLEVVDALHPTARQVGAINVIRCEPDGRWIGAVFDGLGCVLGMQWEGHDPANKNVLLVGAGGAGRAIAFAVASAGARSLTISDVDENRAGDLAKAVADDTGCSTRYGPPDPHGHEIVINATPLGMNKNDPMPVDPERLEPGTLVVDIINSPAPTPLCDAARKRGCLTQNGSPMHKGQALLALRFLGFDYHPDNVTAPRQE